MTAPYQRLMFVFLLILTNFTAEKIDFIPQTGFTKRTDLISKNLIWHALASAEIHC